jgi:hypothetical protein
MSKIHHYAFSVGAFRIGTFLACVFLLVHLFIEPRPEPYFNPIIDTTLLLGAFALAGYTIGLLIWFVRDKSVK